MNNIIFERNHAKEDKEEEEVNYAKYNSLVSHSVINPKPIVPCKEEQVREDLGKIWVDKGEGDVHIFININNKYFYVRFNKCPPEF